MAGEKRRLPIIIGGFEAQAIAIELEKMKPTRPLTHDLFKNFADHFNVNVTEVIINKFEEGIFFSQLICENDGHTTAIDSRTSDAVALAIRFGCPIYALESIIEEAGIEMDDDSTSEDIGVEITSEKESATIAGQFDEYLSEELEDMLKKAISDENYEEASRVRDEINKRKKKD